eukprot:1357236-Prymnesium_polylepis.3
MAQSVLYRRRCTPLVATQAAPCLSHASEGAFLSAIGTCSTCRSRSKERRARARVELEDRGT